MNTSQSSLVDPKRGCFDVSNLSLNVLNLPVVFQKRTKGGITFVPSDHYEIQTSDDSEVGYVNKTGKI